MGGTTVAAAAALASRVCWTCWYVLVAIIGRITGAGGTCIASTVGTAGTAVGSGESDQKELWCVCFPALCTSAFDRRTLWLRRVDTG